MTTAQSSIAQPGDRWLYGPWADLLIGCGVVFILATPLLAYLTYATGAKQWPWYLAGIFAVLLNSPHYGATLVRVYEQRENRQKYAFFAIYVTALLAILFVGSTRSLWLASFLITAYVVWSPWHYAGQNYGLSMMFLRRRGVEVDPATKRALHFSFILSAALAIVAILVQAANLVYAPATVSSPNAPSVMHLPIPSGAVVPMIGAVAVAYLGCLVFAGWRLRARARLGDLLPAGLLALLQAIWFTLPALAFGFAPAGYRVLALAVATVWIAAAHSAQYLWVSAYYAKRSQRDTTTSRFLTKAVLAGSAVTVLPGLLFAPELLGTRAWDAGLAATAISIVNLHHFILDGAIWKLRDGRVARVLLRSAESPAEAAAAPITPRSSWLRPAVYALGALCILVPVGQAYETVFGVYHDRDLARVEQATTRLRWIGRDTTSVQFDVGMRYARLGQHGAAIAHFRRSIELFPTARAWLAIGDQYRQIGGWQTALQAYDAALALKPDLVRALFWRAQALRALGPIAPVEDWRGEAIASLQHLLELKPGQPAASQVLAQLQSEAGHRDDAIRTLEAALRAHDGDSAAVRQQLEALRESSPATRAGETSSAKRL